MMKQCCSLQVRRSFDAIYVDFADVLSPFDNTVQAEICLGRSVDSKKNHKQNARCLVFDAIFCAVFEFDRLYRI